jgi:hypothetical protein
MSNHNSLVASYTSHRLAEDTVRKLHRAGFDGHKLSIIGGGRHKFGELDGATVFDNLGALDKAQYACIPREQVHDYADELNADRLLLFAHGTPDEIEQAKKIIDLTYPDNQEYEIYYGCMD